MSELKKICRQCGICCKLFLINLTKKEWTSGEYKTVLKNYFKNKNFDFVQKYGGNILLQKKDGSCIYLKNNLCSIHKKRPKHCADFSCSSKLTKFAGMMKIIKKRKNIVKT